MTKTRSSSEESLYRSWNLSMYSAAWLLLSPNTSTSASVVTARWLSISSILFSGHRSLIFMSGLKRSMEPPPTSGRMEAMTAPLWLAAVHIAAGSSKSCMPQTAQRSLQIPSIGWQSCRR